MQPPEPFDVVVERRSEEADGVVALDLRRADGLALPEWEPGAHVDLVVVPGLVRQYSLCGRHDEETWRIGVLHEPRGRGGSRAIHESVAVGDVHTIEAVRNNFRLVDGSERCLLIAGGIGVTPLLAMAERLEREGRDWELIYGGRSQRSMAFLERLAQLGGKVQVRPEDRFGLLDLDAALAPLVDGCAVYCCGPPPLLDAVRERWEGRPPELLHFERFSPVERPADEVDTAFEVELASSGERVGVRPGQSIVEALEEAGIETVTSCREGTCGTCITEVLSGIPEHRDSVLSEAERRSNELITICCSRTRDPLLVLDL